MSQRHLVASNDEYKNGFHRMSVAEHAVTAEASPSPNQLRSCPIVDRISFDRLSKEASYASGRILSTMSTLIPVGTRNVRASSRKRRFTRFRETAVCLKRGTTKPILHPVVGCSICARGEAHPNQASRGSGSGFPSCAYRACLGGV